MSEPRHDSDRQSDFSQMQAETKKVNSVVVASFVVEDILSETIDRKQAKDNAFKQRLKQFSQKKVLKNFSQIDNLNTYELAKSSDMMPRSGVEPKALFVDSLLPISASIDNENTYKKNLKNQMDFTCEDLTPNRKRNKLTEEGQKYHKLEWYQEYQEDGFTKELRKMQDEKSQKIHREEKAKQFEAQLLAAKLKEKKNKKEKEEKFSYDYNGVQLKIKAENKANLVTKMVKTNPNTKTKTVKQACDDKNPTTIEDYLTNGVKKNKNSPLGAAKRRDEVKFNLNRSLEEGVQVNNTGVKYTYEGKTKQLKKKSYSTAHLKKTMHERRLSKQQFARVKALNIGMGGLLDEQPIKDETEKKKSKSTANLFKTRRQESPERIITINEGLKQKFLERVQDLLEQPKIEEENPEENKVALGYTDVFNINYLRSGGSLKLNSDKKTIESSGRSSTFLPKISHTSSLSQYRPKERQKIKDSQKLIYDLRKRFDDKLRT